VNVKYCKCFLKLCTPSGKSNDTVPALTEVVRNMKQVLSVIKHKVLFSGVTKFSHRKYSYMKDFRAYSACADCSTALNRVPL
jgi:hypothetical protein